VSPALLHSALCILHPAFDERAATGWILSAAALLLGAVIGSFLNVVIHRYPREESIVFPPSHCPECNYAIKPYDNIPVLSYVILRGRCRNCGTPISPRYPLVELANALFYLAAYLRTGPTIAFLLVAAIVSMTLVLIFIDLDIQILPDVIDLPGMVIGIAIGTLHLGVLYPTMILSQSLLDSLIGAAAGAGVLLAIGLAYRLVRRVEGMGLGDVKMMAMIGACIGWTWIFPLLLISSIAGAVVGLAVASRSDRGMQVPLPFGVFLGLALLAIMFFGPVLERWYLWLLLR
jgi:leader peptidase (prepilin peptidase)/N-methyltransferase